MDEQLKLSHKVVDLVGRANRKFWGTLLPYSADKPEFLRSSTIYARLEVDERFQQIV